MPKPLLGVQPLPECLALLRRHLERAARIRRVQEAGEGFLTAPEHLGIAGPERRHFLRVDPAVVQRRAPVGRALEHRQMAGGLRHFLDRLHAGGAGTDHRHALALEAYGFMRPAGGVTGLALECLHSLDAWHSRCGQRADGSDQEARVVAAAVLQRDIPASRCLLPVCRAHPAAKLDVAAQVEFVSDMVEIAQCLRLGGEMLRPVPFVQQFLRKRIAVGVALGVEARAGISIPVPSAADAGAGLEHPHPHT